jgi:hypothetical protein
MKKNSLLTVLLCFVLAACCAQVVQSQNAVPQTNGRAAVGLNCLSEANGCRIQRIVKGGPAARASLRVGDLLLRLNPSDPAGVVEQIARNAPGTKISLPLQRGNEPLQIAITLEDQLALALRGAALGDAVAEETVGRVYRWGTGVPKNSAEAFRWLLQAADQGSHDAEYEVGSMYAYGDGIPKDDRAAVEWYRKAADQGYAPAQTELGIMYSTGRGVTKDDRVAFDWSRKAAEKGYPLAEYILGVCYENGLGAPKDLKAAVDWYKKAAEHGSEPARQKLATMHQ